VVQVVVLVVHLLAALVTHLQLLHHKEIVVATVTVVEASTVQVAVVVLVRLVELEQLL
jgi:hypothetical protein